MRMNRINCATHLALSTYAALALSLTTPSFAQIAGNCDTDGGCGRMACKAPARPVPQAFWGELEPAGAIPLSRDNTAFNEFQQAYGSRNPFWMAVDVDSGYLYAAISHGIQVWNLQTTPADPAFLKVVDGPSTLRFWPLGEVKQPLRSIDVEGSLGGIVGQAALGTALFDFSNPSSPKFLYQDSGYNSSQIYATTIAGKKYAFVASSRAPVTGALTGVVTYNMTAASALSSCWQGTDNCPNVRLGSLGGSASYVHGAGDYIVFSRGAGGGLEIWDMSNPSAPVQRMVAFPYSTNPEGVYGVALWKQGGSYYLGLRTPGAASIYDVSCISGAGACSPGAPLWSQTMPGGTSEYTVTYSTSGNRKFLYFGNDNKCGSATVPDPQREFLVDVTTPASAHDITPSSTRLVQNAGGAPAQALGYWSWYYRDTPSGFNSIMPRGGKFYNDYFYRAAFGILDVHHLAGGSAPVADFSWSPAEVYPGTPVTFADLSSGGPTSWSWNFSPDGTPASSAARNPAGVSFGSVGTKSVDLTATNAAGPGSASKLLAVLDPAPQIASVTVSPANPLVCQPVTFASTGVTGKPTLTYGWSVTTNPGGSQVATNPTAGFTWNTAGAAPGGYTSTLQVQNSTSTATRAVSFTLGALPTLPTSFTPTNDAFSAGTVQFHVTAAGATEWNWDFGDGAGFTGWTNDPTAGPNPVHTYATVGQKTVVVQVRNCVQIGGQTSGPLTVNIVQILPLIAKFQAVDGQGLPLCGIYGCPVNQGQAVAFVDQSEGTPDHWDYDWNGDGSYEDPGHTTPVTSHTFNTIGNFKIALLVHRGVETKTYFHQLINVSALSPPSITVGGASTANINTAAALFASASNCNTSQTSGWSWSAPGGTIAAPVDGANVSITWTATGTKTVTATNSACAGASGSKQVAVSDPNNNGGTLAAAFSVAPSAPAAGQVVAFSGTASTGSPTAYNWEFGDGQTATGATTTHAYATAGAFNVVLTVTKAGSGTGCISGICAAEKAQTLVVGGPPPLQVDYATTAACVNQFGFDSCAGNVGTSIGFTSTGTGASSLSWSFGDGTPDTTGATATHTYTSAGSYSVTLTGTDGTSTKTKSRSFQVDGPTFDVDYSTSVSCDNLFGLELCSGQTGATISFTAVSATATGFTWSFGDGSPNATGPTAQHVYAAPGAYTVSLTGTDGTSTKIKSRAFQIDGAPIPTRKSVVIPWIAQNPAPAAQTSDLYIYNPSGEALAINVSFRKRGSPDTNPPKIQRTVPAHGALVIGSSQLFTPPNSGFVIVDVDAAKLLPVITVVNTTTSATGGLFSQAIPGVPKQDAASFQSSGQPLTHIVGLGSSSYVGLSNAGDSPAEVRLDFIAQDGRLLSTSAAIRVAGLSQKQFTPTQLRESFSVQGQRDYRIEIESLSNGPVFAFGANRSQTTSDPSFFRGLAAGDSTSYLLGVLNTTAVAGLWQTDLLLANPAGVEQPIALTFVPVGGSPAVAVTIQLKAGETKRLVNALPTTFGVADKTGMVIARAGGVAGIYPVVAAQSYDNTKSTQRYGEAVEPFALSEAAGPGKHMALVGLRQDAAFDTTFWVAGVGSSTALYDIVFRDFQGNVLRRLVNRQLASGKVKQYLGSLVGAAPNGLFTVDLVVRSGRLIAGGNVVTKSTKDPAFVKGRAY